jgi:hypothetical protein
MRPPALVRSSLLLVVLAVLAAGAHAQSVRTLVPDRYDLVAGDPVDLRIGEEAAGERATVAWPEARIRWLFVRVAGTQENLHEVPPLDDGLDFARLRVAHAGVALVGLELEPCLERIPTKELVGFLGKRVGRRTLPVGWRWLVDEEVARVRRIESTKLLLPTIDENGALPSSADAQGKSGQRVEIRPLADPTAVRVGRDLPVRVYLPPGGSSGARVIATHVPSARTTGFTTRPCGTGHFTVDAPGLWSLEAHHARPLPRDPEADWELSTATLSFVVPPQADATEEEGR